MTLILISAIAVAVALAGLYMANRMECRRVHLYSRCTYAYYDTAPRFTGGSNDRPLGEPSYGFRRVLVECPRHTKNQFCRRHDPAFLSKWSDAA